MAIEQLLGDIPKDTFINDYYLKLPFSLPGQAKRLMCLGSWDVVRTILSGPSPDVLAVRDGLLWDAKSSPSCQQARELHAVGYTIFVRHAETHHTGLAELAASFHDDFAAPVDVHIYCTPAEHHGFGWHYDAEDVFILQTDGVKEYSLRKNTVNPWPVVETIPRDMAFGREIMPMMQCILEPGDWLYIPAGYWHMARARSAAISLAVGVMSTTALDVYDFLRGRLLSSLRWRQRLPVPGKASPLSEQELLSRYRAVLAELGDDLAEQLRNPKLAGEFLAAKGRHLDA